MLQGSEWRDRQHYAQRSLLFGDVYQRQDLVYASDDPGRDHLIERIESRNGAHTIDAAYALGFGEKEYSLIEL